jgi:hypothetical protein
MTVALLPLSVLAATPSPGAPEGQLGRIAEQLGVAQPPAPLWLILVTGVMGILTALGFKSFWHLDTVAHEGAHALAAVLIGHRIAGVTVMRDGNGATRHVGRPTAMGSVFVTFVGYVGSSLFGLLGAAMLGADRVVAVLALALVLLALLLFTLRNVFAVILVLMSGIALVGALAGEGLALQRVLAYTMVWFLLAVGAPQLLALRQGRRRMTRAKRRESGSDVDRLRELTWVPGAVWLWLQFVVCAAVLVAGGRLLLR